MNEAWFRSASAEESLTQGDIISDCPALSWRSTALEQSNGSLADDEVFTLPRPVLESLLKARGVSRPQLLPPYREHLSQAFARFFMRVGLPSPVTRFW